ncbi:hypothetical protein [Microbacterium oleivorans]|uniref:hypothetical protein n=1 Tax=Microbacterium oleivorans TaxID=273677 RepID=UPI002041905D|nr:hypothetical protein [Microbacterium oleivorans]MCM3696691.1 hypothetical protein [Microbacterium oleivorans]
MARGREAILVTGTVLVVLYAQLMYLVTQVLTPLSTTPGKTLAEIAAAADAAGEPVFTPLAVALPLGGVALAVAVLVTALRSRAFRSEWVALAYLTLVACGLPVYFALAFGVGMSLADLGGVLPVTGGDSDVWLVLANASFAAFSLALGVSAGLVVRRAGRGTRTLVGPRPAR